MDELLEIIAKRIADTSAHSACDWDFCVPENRAAFLDYAAIALRAIGETHAVIDKDRWQRVLAVARAGDGMFIVDFEVKDDDLFDEEYWENERRERAALDLLP